MYLDKQNQNQPFVTNQVSKCRQQATMTENRVKEIVIETLIELKLVPKPMKKKTIANEYYANQN
jgi:hypothetical protein